jgi:hypothetical protein
MTAGLAYNFEEGFAGDLMLKLLQNSNKTSLFAGFPVKPFEIRGRNVVFRTGVPQYDIVAKAFAPMRMFMGGIE